MCLDCDARRLRCRCRFFFFPVRFRQRGVNSPKAATEARDQRRMCHRRRRSLHRQAYCVSASTEYHADPTPIAEAILACNDAYSRASRAGQAKIASWRHRATRNLLVPGFGTKANALLSRTRGRSVPRDESICGPSQSHGEDRARRRRRISPPRTCEPRRRQARRPSPPRMSDINRSGALKI